MAETSMKPGWCKWRFDQIATNVNERIDNPSKSDFEYYVGLEHIDPDSLKLRRWGVPSDVEATKLIFRKGDIIFGRRRVYQRKISVADFEGICSAHALVLRANSKVIIPELLPFFMQSDIFMERAKAISVGSLSPTINWKTLAKEDFALPSLQQQIHLTKLFLASNSNVESLTGAFDAIRNTEVAWLKHIFEDANLSSAKEYILDEILTKLPHSGVSAPPTGNDTGHWVLALNALSATGYVPEQLKPVVPSKAMLSALLKKGDLLISRSNTIERVGFVGIYNGEKTGSISFPDTMMKLSVKLALLSPEYLEIYLQSPSARRQIMSIAAGTSASMKKINKTNLKKITIPIPNPETQESLVRDRQGIIRSRESISRRLGKAKKQHLSLLNYCFSSSC